MKAIEQLDVGDLLVMNDDGVRPVKDLSAESSIIYGVSLFKAKKGEVVHFIRTGY